MSRERRAGEREGEPAGSRPGSSARVRAERAGSGRGAAPPQPGPAARARLYLDGGHLVATATPTEVTTVLGSCVAVCLFDPGSRVGGVNHFLVPRRARREPSPRFGDVAVPELVRAVVEAGASRDGLVARVFGGASVVPRVQGDRRLGDENAALALELLAALRVPVLEADVGGTSGRTLLFLTDEGTASVRLL